MSGAEFKDPFSALYELGLALFVDDVHDLSKGPLHTTEEIAKGDFPVHHWVYGVCICFFSLVGKVWYALESARQLSQAVQRV